MISQRTIGLIFLIGMALVLAGAALKIMHQPISEFLLPAGLVTEATAITYIIYRGIVDRKKPI